MKITIICDVLGEANNGTTLAAMNLIRFLREKGHQLTVVAPDAPNEEGFVSVRPVNLGKFLNGVLKRNGVKLAKPDKRLLEDAIKDADLVHLLIPFPLSVAAVKIAEKYKKPITASFHCQAENFTAHLGMMDMRLANKLTYKTFYRLVYRHCDAVHYPTEFIRDVFENQTHPTNGYVISNGVNDVFTRPAERTNNSKFTIVCSGRYSREKAQQQLIKAISRSRHRDEIQVIFAGDGPRKNKLISLAKKENINCQFKFFSRAELVKVLQSADLYVHTAVIEIEAIACMEAICCGLVPVICNSPRSATRFFALGDNTLFEQYNEADLAEKIDYWFEHPQERDRRSDEYSELRRGFSQIECMEKMEQMLLRTAHKKQ